jgi:glucose-1-phosphate cytidylyltransferase
MWINGGYFIFNRAIFDYMRPGEELVERPFARLMNAGQLTTYRHHGFWACMDTFKEKVLLDEMYARGERPWAVWERGINLPVAWEQANVTAD